MVRYCEHCGTACEANRPFCTNCGAALPAADYRQPSPVRFDHAPSELNDYQEMPMKWFKFVIYFQLFANALSNIGTAIMTMTGSHYGGEADRVYDMVEGLQTFDMLYGVLLIGVAIFALYARSRLKNFCKNGPNMYYVVLAAGVVMSLVYLVGSSMLVAESPVGEYYDPDFSSTFTSIGATAALIACNVTYFGKRKHLFTED